MFCANCGAKNDDKSIFCENCGVRLNPIKGDMGQTTGSDIPNSTGMTTVIETFQKAMKNKMLVVALAIAVVVVVAFVISYSAKSALLGTWEERSFTTAFGTTTYETGEGDKFTLGRDGVIIDSDHFLGSEFAYYYSVDVISWKVVDDTLLFYTKYGEVEYVPYKLNGKTLTLYFNDTRSAVLYKVK